MLGVVLVFLRVPTDHVDLLRVRVERAACFSTTHQHVAHLSLCKAFVDALVDYLDKLLGSVEVILAVAAQNKHCIGLTDNSAPEQKVH